MRKVCVMHQASIGDTLLATPVFRAIKETFPGCRTVGVTSHAGYELLRGVPFVDLLVPYRKGDPVLPVLKAIWRADAALVLDLHYRNALYAFLALIPKRVGLGKDFINVRFQDLPLDVYEPRKYLNYAAQIGAAASSIELARPVPTAEEAMRARALCDGLRARPGQKVVLLAPYSLDPLKDWEPPKYLALAQRIRAAGHVPALIGGPECRDRAGEDFPGVANLAGETNLRETTELIEQADLLVCGCTSVLHICSTTSTPSVAIYGPSDPRQWAPKHGCTVVTHRFPCSPCHNISAVPCRDNRCIQEIPVDEVWGAVGQALQTGG